jgi:hypothetical protein
MRLPIIAAIVIFALAGCASSSPEAVKPTVEESTPSPVSDPLLFCEKLGDSLSDYASFILEAATSDVNMSDFEIQLSRIEAMEEVVPADAKAMLAQYADPVYQIKAVVDAGGGSISFNTDGYKDANLDLMGYCVDAGYNKG